VTRALLDVNVLLALLDSDHADHVRATAWLDRDISGGWATCAITENGFVRVLSQPRYPSPVSPTTAMDLLSAACDGGHHEFWPSDVRLLDPDVIDRSRVHGPRQVTDAYLLALAVAHDGRLVTLDRGLALATVRGATPDHLLVL